MAVRGEGVGQRRTGSGQRWSVVMVMVVMMVMPRRNPCLGHHTTVVKVSVKKWASTSTAITRPDLGPGDRVLQVPHRLSPYGFMII